MKFILFLRAVRFITQHLLKSMILTMTPSMSGILQVIIVHTPMVALLCMGPVIGTVAGAGVTGGHDMALMDAITDIITTMEDGIAMTGIAITMANMLPGIIVIIPTIDCPIEDQEII